MPEQETVVVAETHGERINAQLAELNPLMFGEGSRLELRWVRWVDVHEQDINANVMPTGMFNQLVANVSKNKALESVPLCATREGSDRIEAVSGHHRMRAAKAAGLVGGVILLYKGLSLSEIRAKQLSHNSIAGQSDPEIVKTLFEQIDGVQERIESYIDPKIFDTLPSAVSFSPVGVDPLADAKTVTIVFLPTQQKDFQTALDLLDSGPDTVYLAHRDAFEGFKDAVQAVKSEMEIVSYPTALAMMGRLAVERLAQLKLAQNDHPEQPRTSPAVKYDEDMLDALRREV